MSRRAAEILLDDARPGRERVRRFRRPGAIIQTDDPAKVAACLAMLENARRGGRHAAGYFSYELGYALESRLRPLMPQARAVPLLWFGIFDSAEEFTGADARRALEEKVCGRAYAGPLRHEWNADAYGTRFDHTHALIGSGDIYQANLSFRSRFAFVGDPMAFYLKLREQSASAHCAFIDDGERHILSLSPELFFATSRSGDIVAKPMKGTAPRGEDPAADDAARTALQMSEKDRSENLMIVDLLRNDLGRVAETGSVSVENPFAVETYPTVHQMVSTVRAKLRSHTTVGDLAAALFPCGSVTGTPKIRAMEIIRELEESPRGVYCGAIGHFAPDGSADFNVAIRTVTLLDGHGELGIGGAVIHDSSRQAEYAECLLKARYFELARKPVELIETLRHAQRGGFMRQELHLTRMERSARTFGITFDRKQALHAMDGAVAAENCDLRVRLALHENGSFSCSAAPLPPIAPQWTFAISPLAINSRDILLRHKTSWREIYESEMARALDCDEIVFVNEHGALTEGSRSNIFVSRDGRLMTPPLEDGVLDGCLRRELILQGDCVEQTLTPYDLKTADKIFLGNSLRGLIRAVAR